MFAPKKGDSFRNCVVHNKGNTVEKIYFYPMPRNEIVWNHLEAHRYYVFSPLTAAVEM